MEVCRGVHTGMQKGAWRCAEVCMEVVGKDQEIMLIKFLGGLSLHLNHFIASHAANYNWPFGTLPF